MKVTLAIGKTVVVTGWNGEFSLSFGALFKILTVDDKLAGTLALGTTGAFVATIVTAAIDENISVIQMSQD